jgi:hypothetical protein
MSCVKDFFQDKVSWRTVVIPKPKPRRVVINRAAGDTWNATERDTNDMHSIAIADWGKEIRIAGLFV